MTSRRLWCGALAALALPAATPVSAGGLDASAGVARHVVAEAESSGIAYWTPARMKAATPLTEQGPDDTAVAGPPAGTPLAGAGRGARTVGALFFDNGNGNHYCTAGVLRTPKRNLLVTAAHCLYNPATRRWNTQIVFVPGYSHGDRPYGTWPVRLMIVDKRWSERADPDMDVGFAAVRRVGGHRIADVVGGNRLLIGQGYVNRVTVIGYPAKANFPNDEPIWCTNSTQRQAAHQMRFDCGGFFGGTSGSPWLMDYDARTQSGYVIGVIGGYQRGGYYDWRSYSPVFGRDVGDLVTTADDRA